MRIVNERITVIPYETLSPDSGGKRNTSKVRTDISTHGRMKFMT